MQTRILLLFLVVSLQATAQINTPSPDSLPVHRTTFYKAAAFTTGYYATSLLVLSKTWYKGRERVPFHFYNDNRGYMQVDKLGHTFGAYVYSYIGYHYLLHAGLTRSEALTYGATLGLVLQTPIEIMDGIYEGYGFSWGDMAANTMGSALVLGQELLFNEQLIKYKFSYWESRYARQANGYLGTTTLNRMLDDYNGHTYWLSMPLSRLTGIEHIPSWICISAGYSANGMFGEFENITSYNGVPIPETIRYRQYLLSLDIDWTRIPTSSRFLKTLFKGMTFIKLPFVTLEYNSKGQFKGYWVYY